MIGQAAPLPKPAGSWPGASFRRSAIDAAPVFCAKATPACSASARRFMFSPGYVVGRGGPNEPPLCEMAPWKRPLACGDAREHAHRDAARRLPEDRHPVGIAAEGRDVPLHPLQAGDEVQEAVVAGSLVRRLRGQLGMREEAERPHAVVDAHEHDPLAREVLAVVDRAGGGAEGEPAAVDPDEHRDAVARRTWPASRR